MDIPEIELLIQELTERMDSAHAESERIQADIAQYCLDPKYRPDLTGEEREQHLEKLRAAAASSALLVEHVTEARDQFLITAESIRLNVERLRDDNV